MLFDRYIAVDWSARNEPNGGEDSIWIGEASRDGAAFQLSESANPRTRSEAMRIVLDRIKETRAADKRILIGFDFPFGFPSRAAERIGGRADWRALWESIHARISDDDRNRSNRFEVAAAINIELRPDGPFYWGHAGVRLEGLRPNRDGLNYSAIDEKRIAERRANAKSVWQLNGAGSVGGQALTGIARLEGLRRSAFAADLAIWPFQTDFQTELIAPIIIAEIYPSIFSIDKGVLPKDRAQVEAVAHGFAELDARGQLSKLLSSPPDLSGEHRALVVAEEGWILGVGHDALRESVSLPPRQSILQPTLSGAYLRDPDAIYAQSFAIIRAEADLAHLPPVLHPLAVRMIHACGMVDLADDIVGDARLVEAVENALGERRLVLCDSEMVAAGIHSRVAVERLVTLNEPTVPNLAARLSTTRSAAAVELWRDRLEGAVVVIGNAPTALFHLLEMIDGGAAKPAAIIATPVGFVGAAESKAELAANPRGIPFITVQGRRGGSAIAAAALNAVVLG